jgi:hypothetical protein
VEAGDATFVAPGVPIIVANGAALEQSNGRGHAMVAGAFSRMLAFAGAILLLGVVCASAGAATAPVSAYPSPGTKLASASTQISFRGVVPASAGSIAVSGSRSGAHTGRLAAHSDGKGVSFLPDHPFTAGETVTVHTALGISGGKDGTFSIGIATQGPPLKPARVPAPIVSGSGVQRFHSRPDLAPAKLSVATSKPGIAPGDVFLGQFSAPGQHGPGQAGPMVIDPQGRLIWFHPMHGSQLALDVRAQQYDGQPVMTWWQGDVNAGVGIGSGIIFDRAYHRIAVVNAGNGYRADPHEFLLTPGGTAFLLVENPVVYDLSSVHGAKRAVVLDSVVQAIDVKTGLVQFEWHSLDHVDPSESYIPPVKVDGHIDDYFHINSVTVNRDGDPIVSARNTWAVYKIDAGTGAVVWRLNGKKSSFKMAQGSTFAWQHDARILPDGTITLFDDGAAPAVHTQSHGIGIRVNTHKKDAWLVHNYVHTPKVLANSQGNSQTLPNSNTFVGWGSAPLASEFSPHGQLLFDLRFPVGAESYRAYRLPWDPQPTTAPAIAASSDSKGTDTVYASWNGAANVASWEVLAGPSATTLAPVASVAKSDFETKATVRTAQPFVAVQAKNAAGAVLATSTAITPKKAR